MSLVSLGDRGFYVLWLVSLLFCRNHLESKQRNAFVSSDAGVCLFVASPSASLGARGIIGMGCTVTSNAQKWSLVWGKIFCYSGETENEKMGSTEVAYIHTCIPFCILPCTQPWFDLISGFHPLNLNFTSHIGPCTRQSGVVLVIYGWPSSRWRTGFLGWAMGSPHGTAKPWTRGLHFFSQKNFSPHN